MQQAPRATQDQNPQWSKDSSKVGLFRGFKRDKWERYKSGSTRSALAEKSDATDGHGHKRQKTGAAEKQADLLAGCPGICITLPLKPREGGPAFQDFLNRLALRLNADHEAWESQQIEKLYSIFNNKVQEAIEEGTRVVGGDQFLRDMPSDDISDRRSETVGGSAAAAVEAHDRGANAPLDTL